MDIIKAPTAAVVNRILKVHGQQVGSQQLIMVLAAMKLYIDIKSDADVVIDKMYVEEGEIVEKGQPLCRVQAIQPNADVEHDIEAVVTNKKVQGEEQADSLVLFKQRLEQTHDGQRDDAVNKRHQLGFRSARENLADLCELDAFIEYGQLTVAAQRSRRDIDDLRTNTAGDGIITGVGTMNAHLFAHAQALTAIIVNDYTVLAGTQGYFHHKKLDRILAIARQRQLPIVMYTEGGGGRPGDTDVLVMMAGLNVTSFREWAGLCGVVPRIAINNGYCFAGNAALFGCADIRIATESSCLGMAGPAMIEGGGIGKYAAEDIGPIDVQRRNGVVDIVCVDEAEATQVAKQVLGYFQGKIDDWQCADQQQLWSLMPKDRQQAYDVRTIIQTLVDTGSYLELQSEYGQSMIVALVRIEGIAFGLIANDCCCSGGAIEVDGAEKAARFLKLFDQHGLPVLSLCDTPGFMVGPKSEEQAAVAKMSHLFVVGAQMRVQMVTIFLRKAYGLGAMAMAGGSFTNPVLSIAWPSGEFGAMGLEGAVKLGFKKELQQQNSDIERQMLYDDLLSQSYDKGKATEAASYLEIDAVIDPQTTRQMIVSSTLNHQR